MATATLIRCASQQLGFAFLSNDIFADVLSHCFSIQHRLAETGAGSFVALAEELVGVVASCHDEVAKLLVFFHG